MDRYYQLDLLGLVYLANRLTRYYQLDLLDQCYQLDLLDQCYQLDPFDLFQWIQSVP